MSDALTARSTSRTLSASALGAGDSATGAITPPIHVATTYLRDADNRYRSGLVYGRSDNASVHQVEALVAELERADDAMLFSSGTAAAAAVILSLDPGHIVVPSAMYWGLREWLDDIHRYNHTLSFVDMSDLDAVEAAIIPGKTRLVWIETPSNPLWTITDITAVSDIAHRSGAFVCADSTASTPILTRPLELGADLVLHSATKYLNGHSDVAAGALAAAKIDKNWSRIRNIRARHGALLGSFDAWLLLRGLRTLDLRVKAQSETAAFLAKRLLHHPLISSVLYPGLSTHPGHAVAARQMKGGFGGMLSFRVRGSAGDAIAVAGHVSLWRRATSFGGIESLIEHRASMEGACSTCPDDLLRLSVGLEDPQELLADLWQSLNRLR